MSDQSQSRPTAHDIFDGVLFAAREELGRTSQGLAFSALAAGLAMGFTGLGVASAHAVLGDAAGADFVALLFYPLGFIAVIVGRQQLFTENTLYPVALALDEAGHWLNTLRLWAVVFVANVAGATAFALLAVLSGALSTEIVDELVRLGRETWEGRFHETFASGVVGGWIIALVAWLVTASRTTTGQILLVWSLTFLVGLAGLDHCIASAAEILAAVVEGEIGVGDFLLWLLAATAGNIVGGVVIVTILNYAQVVAGGGGEGEGSGG